LVRRSLIQLVTYLHNYLQIYNEIFGIRVILVSSVTIASTELLETVGNSVGMLDSFTTYLQHHLQNNAPSRHDSIMLLT